MLYCTRRLITFFTVSRKPFYGATVGEKERDVVKEREAERLGYLETNKLCFSRRGAGRWDGRGERNGRRTNEVAESNRCAGSRTSKRETRRRARFPSSFCRNFPRPPSRNFHLRSTSVTLMSSSAMSSSSSTLSSVATIMVATA